MKKRVLKSGFILLILFGFVFNGVSQDYEEDVKFNSKKEMNIEYMHSLGLSTSVFLNLKNTSGVGLLIMPMLTYNPRLNFVFSDLLSVSAAAYPSVGFSGSINSNSGANFRVGLEMPVVAQLNIGHHSSRDNMDSFGAYIAGGYGMGYLTTSYAGSAVYHGPVAIGGVNFEAGMSSSINIMLKYQYEVTKIHIFGLGVLYNFY